MHDYQNQWVIQLPITQAGSSRTDDEDDAVAKVAEPVAGAHEDGQVDVAGQAGLQRSEDS